MATQLNYTSYPIGEQISDESLYYSRIVGAPSLDAGQTLRDVMAYQKITAYSESTVTQLLNDLIQGAIDRTAQDGQTRNIGQMLRVYMAIEGSSISPILTQADKNRLAVRVQLLKDMRYPVDPSNFTLSSTDGSTVRLEAVHYEGQTTNANELMFGANGVITGRNLLSSVANGTVTFRMTPNADSPWGEGFQFLTPVQTDYNVSSGAIVIAPPDFPRDDEDPLAIDAYVQAWGTRNIDGETKNFLLDSIPITYRWPEGK